jgi:lipopolysaccharide transport system ATP-binding protein
MYVRLAFSVAAHLDPDILIIDEVLAVGDIEFQKKCLGKMEEITKKEGRTILFVSHNMVAVRQLCKRCILLDRGTIKHIGPTEEVLELYTKERAESRNYSILSEKTRHGSVLQDAQITTTAGSDTIRSTDTLRIAVTYNASKEQRLVDGRLVLTILNERSQQTVMVLDSYISSNVWEGKLPATGTIVCETEKPIDLAEGAYTVHFDFLIDGTSVDYARDGARFEVITDLADYNYKNNPDRTVCQRLIPHRFTVDN